MKEFNIATVGNPNSGKTTTFNALTGANQQVGNWSGVTVDKKTGQFQHGNVQFNLTDLPGIYSLDDQNQAGSIDEQIAFNYVMENKPDLIINILDATCLERSLYLALQLRELGLPQLVAINKIDNLDKGQVNFDLAQLSRDLGCPVIALSAVDKQSVQKLKSQLEAYIEEVKSASAVTLELPTAIDMACEKVASKLANILSDISLAPRALALRLLEGDSQLLNRCSEQLKLEISQIAASIEYDLDLEIADARYSRVYTLLQACKAEKVLDSSRAQQLTQKIDSVLIHPVFGIPIFLVFIYLLFMFTINVGSAFIDFFDITVGALLVDGSRLWFESMGLPSIVITVLSDGIGAGIQTVATFIPVVAALFLGLSVLERSGYMARAAFVIDAFMQKIGLPGKAFVPLIIGFGCSVPAIMATRTLEQERERITTAMMSPFMSCGAKLPVYVLFATAFFPSSGQNLVFALYIIGILVAVATGLLLKKTLLPGSSDHVVMELPNYEFPGVVSILLTTWQRLKRFILGAGQTIVVVVALLNIANSVSFNGDIHAPGEGDSVLSETARVLTPLLAPIGIKEENWPATVGVITGIFAKEAVVGTLDSLYVVGDAEGGGEFSLSERFSEAFDSIGDNLLGISAKDPLGIEVGDLSDQESAAQEQEVAVATFDSMKQQFDGQLGAFAYLLFILLYMPCAAAMGALVKEVGRKWAIFAAAWSTGLAFSLSTLFYQISFFSLQPMTSVFWIAVIVISLIVCFYMMKRKGKMVAMRQVYDFT